ncbi:MAG: universal stress protein [Chloroflexi bacterium]|nr:MAG: universal stress protein [Chloroflexota bacterium]
MVGRRARTIPLRDGSLVRIRPIAPDDRQALRAAWDRLSPESRYRRFLSPMPELSESMLDFLTEVDHHDHEALLAVDTESEDAVGVARYVRSAEDPDVAEVAITVDDAWQGRGLGTLLLGRLATRARGEGVRRFSALVMADNPRALRVIRGIGDSQTSRDGAYVELRVELPARRGVGADLSRLLRETATGSVVFVGGAVRHAMSAAQPRPRPEAPPPAADGELRSIVAGTDGSATAERAVRQAVALAASFGARLHLVSAHRLEGGAAPPDDLRAVPDGLSDLGWQVTTAGAAEAVPTRAAGPIRRAGVDVVTHARRGDPVGALIAVAEEETADLIVVGSKGVRSARRLVVGSVAGSLLRHAPCGVYVVRTD